MCKAGAWQTGLASLEAAAELQQLQPASQFCRHCSRTPITRTIKTPQLYGFRFWCLGLQACLQACAEALRTPVSHSACPTPPPPHPHAATAPPRVQDLQPLRLPAISTRKRVVLVRHGQSTWNAEGRIQGSSDLSELTTKGMAQAETTRDMVSGGGMCSWGRGTTEQGSLGHTCSLLKSCVQYP